MTPSKFLPALRPLSSVFRLLSSFFCVSLAASAAEPTPAEIVSTLVRQNDARLPAWLAPTAATTTATARGSEPSRLALPREASRVLKMCVAAYAHPESHYHHHADTLALIDRLARQLRRLQSADGSLDAEFAAGNPQSPPDTAFALRHLAQAQSLLLTDAATDARARATTAPVRELLRDLLQRGAPLLRTGGVHTPNHRWVICGALAHLQSLYPSPANLARIDDWLGEGIDQDADGQFSERSTIYSYVTDEGLLDLALHLDRPALLEPIRRNLELLLDLADPDGELETVASRRQDQQGREPRRLSQYYIPLRHLALALNHSRFAAAARAIERTELASVTDQLAEFMTQPVLLRSLPPSTPATTPENFTRHVANSGLVRLRRGPITATIFGGSDWPAVRDISSGLSTNPTFFRFRKGAAVLDSIRLSPAFFNLGYFRSEGLTVTADVREFSLHQTQRAAYYQPLPAEFRRASGDYPLTPDGRFYSKLDFPHRPRDEKTLTTRITVREMEKSPGAFELTFAIDDTPGIAVTLELCFRPGGTLTGAEPRTSPTDPDTFFLKSSTARYTVGSDTIEFGPGSFGSARVSLAGEDYSWRNGQLRTEGVRVYLTGVTPFRHTLLIR